jgi:hypothetical protein
VSTNISPKVNAAAAGSAIAAAVVTILVWVAGMLGVNVPVEVAGAATIVLAGIASWVSGYLVADPARGPN